MKIEIKGVKVNYKVEGEGEPLVLLHGWGSEISTVASVAQIFIRNGYKVYSLDLPGFGYSEKPETAWEIYDYDDCVTKFINALKLDYVTLAGHSFGGAICLSMAHTRILNIKAMFLIDSAGVRRPLTAKRRAKVILFKVLKYAVKVLPLVKRKKQKLLNRVRNKVGSADYNAATGVMKETLVRVVNCDLSNTFEKILVKTSIIWGAEDMDAPVSSGQLMNSLIRGSSFRTIERTGHFPFLENYAEFKRVLEDEIRGMRS